MITHTLSEIDLSEKSYESHLRIVINTIGTLKKVTNTRTPQHFCGTEKCYDL